ncbi:MAG: hypothetical protein HUJ69_07100 [Lachnospiraceae bacterium]|nr:hypothetical protein [Lachnospiraceae bacterium]
MAKRKKKDPLVGILLGVIAALVVVIGVLLVVGKPWDELSGSKNDKNNSAESSAQPGHDGTEGSEISREDGDNVDIDPGDEGTEAAGDTGEGVGDGVGDDGEGAGVGDDANGDANGDADADSTEAGAEESSEESGESAAGQGGYADLIESYRRCFGREISIYDFDSMYGEACMLSAGTYSGAYYVDDAGYVTMNSGSNVRISYAMYDVDRDGNLELLVAEHEATYGYYQIHDIWTLRGEPTFVVYGDARFDYRPTEDGYLFYYGSGGIDYSRVALYRIDGQGNLEAVHEAAQEYGLFSSDGEDISEEEYWKLCEEYRATTISLDELNWKDLY